MPTDGVDERMGHRGSSFAALFYGLAIGLLNGSALYGYHGTVGLVAATVGAIVLLPVAYYFDEDNDE